MFRFFDKAYQSLEDEDEKPPAGLPSSGPFRMPFVWSIVTLLLLSISGNVFLYQKQRTLDSVCLSTYAHLGKDVMSSFNLEGHENDNYDEMWTSPSEDRGLVALTDEYVAQMQLPHAQRWPWDTTKGIYFLQGHHNLHCIKTLRQSIQEFRNNSLQSAHHWHIDHCLGILREDILCNADDTPRHTGGHHEQPGSGQGQYRACRDWNKLEIWANEHSACYKAPDDPYDGVPEELSYTHCPDGSDPRHVY